MRIYIYIYIYITVSIYAKTIFTLRVIKRLNVINFEQNVILLFSI